MSSPCAVPILGLRENLHPETHWVFQACKQGNPRVIFSQKCLRVMLWCHALSDSPFTGRWIRILMHLLCFVEAQGISKGAHHVLATGFPSGLCTSSTMPLRITLFLCVRAENHSMGSKIPLDLCCSWPCLCYCYWEHPIRSQQEPHGQPM